MAEIAQSVPEHTTIAACLREEKSGFTVGQRLSVPFLADFVSVQVAKQTSFLGSDDVITDFSPFNNRLCIVEKADRTDIYVRSVSDLQETFGHWKGELLMTCCEKDADFFDTKNHIRLALRFRDDRPEVKIERADAVE